MSAAWSPHTVAQRPARPPAASQGIPIRTVPRAAVEVLAARLLAQRYAHV